MPGIPRPAIDAMPAYKPGKSASAVEEEHGITEAIKLASNETPWPPIPAVQQAIIDAASGVNRYADHRAGEVRSALANWLGVATPMVTVGCGSVGLLQQLVLTYLDKDDEVVFPWRSFEVYPVYARLVEARTLTPPLAAGTIDLDSVADSITSQTKLVILSNPNNPTGTAHSTQAIGALLDNVDSRTLVVVDEAYHEFMSPSLGDSVTDLIPKHDNLMVLRTFSKAQGMAALRFGYGVAHSDVIAAIDKTLFPFAVNGIAQAAALAVIEHADEVQTRVAQIVAERQRVSEELRVKGLPVLASEANFVYLPLGVESDRVGGALERLGVVTRVFSGDGIRVTISTPEENDRLLSSIDQATKD